MMDERTDGRTSLLFFAYGSEVERRPVKELYAVFRRPRNVADRAAGEVAARQGALDLGDFEPDRPRPSGISDDDWRRAQLGNVVKSEGRLLLAGLGGDADMLYAAPTDNDAVAHALLPNGGGGCSHPGPDGIELGWHQDEAGDLVVFGLVGDSVEAVDLLVGRRFQHARMGENAFGLRLENTAGADLRRVVLRRCDGTTNEFELSPAD
jgi:hypothetical protein